MCETNDRPHLAVCLGMDFRIVPVPVVRRVRSTCGDGWGMEVKVRRGLRVWTETQWTNGTEFPSIWNRDEAEASLAIEATKRLLERMGPDSELALAAVGGAS